jgi:predicted dehydrogenase
MKIDVVIIGTGMYVCGRGTDDFGTVLPAMCELSREEFPFGHIFIAGNRYDGVVEARKRLDELNAYMGTCLEVQFLPEYEFDAGPQNYLEAIEHIQKPACAVIVVPDHLHASIGADCMNAGLHVLMVKPLTTTLEEACRLVEIQKSKRLHGAVEFHKRFDRSNLKLKEVLHKGRLGQPLYFLVEYSQRKIIPSRIFTSWVRNTNIFQYLGVHYVDIIYYVTRAVPVRVMAVGQSGWCRENDIDALDAVHATIMWRLESGGSFISYLLTNWIDPNSTTAMSDQRIKVIGTAGRYEADQKRRGMTVVTDTGGVEEPNPDFCARYLNNDGLVSYAGYGIESIQTFVRDVLDLESGTTSLDHLSKIRPTFEESLPSTAVIEAANQSLGENGKWIDIAL